MGARRRLLVAKGGASVDIALTRLASRAAPVDPAPSCADGRGRPRPRTVERGGEDQRRCRRGAVPRTPQVRSAAGDELRDRRLRAGTSAVDVACPALRKTARIASSAMLVGDVGVVQLGIGWKRSRGLTSGGSRWNESGGEHGGNGEDSGPREARRLQPVEEAFVCGIGEPGTGLPELTGDLHRLLTP